LGVPSRGCRVLNVAVLGFVDFEVLSAAGSSSVSVGFSSSGGLEPFS
jgi:hypothetical protein